MNLIDKMYIFISIVLYFYNPSQIAACSCNAQPNLNIKSLNDSELIFTATLLEYKIGMSVVSLKFLPIQIYKGVLDDTISIYLESKNSHTFFNKSVKFIEKEDWIIFARKKEVGKRTYYRLNDAEGSSFCALSRPLEKNPDKDNYIAFLVKKSAQPDGFQQIFNEEDTLIAEGFYKNNTPILRWTYFRTNGRPDITGEYKFGKKNGEWQKYNSSSKGEPIVIQKRFYDQGELKEIHDLKYSGAVSFKKFLSDTAEIRHYLFDDGTINSITHRSKDDDTMRTTSYYKNGVIREEKYFEKEKLIRKYQYDEHGMLTEQWFRDD